MKSDDSVWIDSIADQLRSLYGVSDLGEQEHRAAIEQLHRRSDRYRVEGEIARGGMGVVLRAWDLDLEREVAMKVALDWRPDGGPPPDLRANRRLLAEARVLGSLQHPGVVPIHELGCDSRGHLYFTMPLLEGRMLTDVMGRAEADLEHVVQVLIRICETLAHAHIRGVVHCDLKPANVMLGRFGEVYVLDWGLAELENREGVPGGVEGTPYYMAPERVLATGQSITSAVDVYALGAMLYESVKGCAPYREHGLGARDVLDQIRQAPPLPLTDGPTELRAICAQAMARDPGERYENTIELGSDLRAWSEGRSVVALPPGPWLRLLKWGRRNPLMVRSLGVAVCVFLVTVMVLLYSLRVERDRATLAAREADVWLETLLELSVVEGVADLRARANDRLLSLGMGQIEGIESWLLEAESLITTRDELARRSITDLDPQRTRANRWYVRLLASTKVILDEFLLEDDAEGLPLGSSLPAMRRRLVWMQQQAQADANLSTEWRDAAAFLAKDQRFAGIDLSPQTGLVPLGPDQSSGLLEFAVRGTGMVPQRGVAGRIQPESASAVVLVLLPGGNFVMGASQDGGDFADPWASEDNERPTHRVELDPFFLAKYECTQAQWRCITGTEPSNHAVDSSFVEADMFGLHPVESVSWSECQEVLAKLGLGLPTEAQWEYGARAGTRTPWCGVISPAGLINPPAGNLADRTSLANTLTSRWGGEQDLVDGFVMHAPVGRYPANPFGLHDLLGNVWEWCGDGYLSYTHPARKGDGLREADSSLSLAIYRGGAFDQPAREARVANRAGAPLDYRYFTIGLRIARVLAR